MNEYREQLYQNLKSYFKGSGWYGVRHFYNGRDEIQLILPDTLSTEVEFSKLFDILSELPEIDLPRERVYISYCHEDWRDYHKVLINPTQQDVKELTLIPHFPEKWLTPEENENYLAKTRKL